MVRGKIQMKRIENATSRQVTFSKRRNGLLKKAYELSVLCEAEVAVIVFSQKGRLHEFSSTDMQKTIERYYKHAKGGQTNNTDQVEQYMQRLKRESASMAKKIEHLDDSQRKLLGHGLSLCTFEELQEIESQLGRSLRSIRARKAQLFVEQITQLKAKESLLLEENARLREQYGAKNPREVLAQEKDVVTNCSRSCQSSQTDVETELFIGLPEMRCSKAVKASGVFETQR
ncbi:MADS-box protein AGL42-like isoform X1 [Alnus glutinosa]|uniref:MADS-box protein AGL42-like isoform X1 n=1 Tax=Alnus glutinosa TaxID=3517 RepID=UPI002D7A36B9|nr:MADS-box protein AGL42-like isoform X1 [Alnus glutinosa]XP_062153619.1 MADS-box protein AGL42-like isoform X1 [Alnus glutinosa]XP_062153620.1 MADS-box protein AGL42-like isoform X1 [Alnus glutinosa]